MGKNGLQNGLRWKWTDLDEIWNSVSQKCGGLALADFGRDPRSSNSLRKLFFQKTQGKNSQNFQVLQIQAVVIPQWLQMPKSHG